MSHPIIELLLSQSIFIFLIQYLLQLVLFVDIDQQLLEPALVEDHLGLFEDFVFCHDGVEALVSVVLNLVVNSMVPHSKINNFPWFCHFWFLIPIHRLNIKISLSPI